MRYKAYKKDMRNIKAIIVVMAAVVFASCASQQDVVYLQDTMNSAKDIAMKQTYEVKIQPDDMLAILVNSRDPQLAAQFNMPIVGYQLGNSISAEQVTTTNSLQGYLVNKDGDINFPVLGEIKVAGMTRTQLTEMLEKRLRSEGEDGAYVKDAIVTVKFLNYKISVLGEVNRPGNYSLNSDRITVLEALALAGDMTIYGQRENVHVIRDNNGQTQNLIVNLKSSDLFNQEGYYLQQNDVVYVIPNKIKAQQSGINQNNNVSVWLSAASLIATVLSIIF